VDIDIQCISLIEMVIQQCVKEVMRSGDGMKISGKVEIDIRHRNHLCVSATGRATFDAKTRTQRWLTERDAG
jgi:hypothetical protein